MARRILNVGLQAQSLLAPPITLTDSTTIATDAGLGNHFRVTLAGNRTLGNPTNPADGQRVMWELIQDATGSRTLALGTDFLQSVDFATITLSVSPGKRDFLGAVYCAAISKWVVVSWLRADGFGTTGTSVPFNVLRAAASAGLTVTTTAQDVPGATVTVTAPVAGTKVMVSGIFDVSCSAGGDTFIGELLANGVNPGGEALSSVLNRLTVAQTWAVTLGAGSNTLKLRASKLGAASNVSLSNIHTTVTVAGQFT